MGAGVGVLLERKNLTQLHQSESHDIKLKINERKMKLWRFQVDVKMMRIMVQVFLKMVVGCCPGAAGRCGGTCSSCCSGVIQSSGFAP